MKVSAEDRQILKDCQSSLYGVELTHNLVSDIEELEAIIAKLTSAANKVILCFPPEIPEGQETVEFAIPGYIIDELAEAVKESHDLQS